MQFYRASSFLFPRPLRVRLFALCCVTTAMPLISYIAWGTVTGRMTSAELIILTLATAAGTITALRGTSALLGPVDARKDMPDPPEEEADFAPGDRWTSPLLPELGEIFSRLYAGVRRLPAVTQAQIDELNIAAHEDALTGIANRRGFLAQLDVLPPGRRQGCVAIIDIDHFSQVNDLRGRAEGDRVLSDFAARLSSQIRRVDIIARWGGEEFAIFYQDSIEDEASWSLARIAERMRKEPVAEIGGQPVTFSAGLSRWRSGPASAAIARADEALRLAKLSGRGQVQRAERAATPHYL